MSTVKECDYSSVALTSIRQFAVVRAVQRSSAFREYLPAREKKTDRAMDWAYHNQENANSIRLPVYNV